MPDYGTSDEDANCVSPGGTLAAWPIAEKYPDLSSITKLELVIYRMRLLQASDGTQYWNGKQDPEYYDLNYSFAGNQISTSIPSHLTGLPPTAADVRMTYINNNGYTRQVLFEDGRGSHTDHKLFFVPKYSVLLGRRRVDIGFDLFSRTMTGATTTLSGLFYPRGWERYCQLYRASIFDPTFPGTAKFWDVPPSLYNPGHGYYIEMPASTSGFFHFEYQIICPKGMQPSGSEFFSSLGVMGGYTGDMIRGGLPRYTEVSYPPNSWHPPDHPDN